MKHPADIHREVSEINHLLDLSDLPQLPLPPRDWRRKRLRKIGLNPANHHIAKLLYALSKGHITFLESKRLNLMSMLLVRHASKRHNELKRITALTPSDTPGYTPITTSEDN